METYRRRIEALEQELEEAKRQVNYERKEKEHWLTKYTKLRLRHGGAFPTARQRRSSRDEADDDDTESWQRQLPRPLPAPAIENVTQVPTAIDLTSPSSRHDDHSQQISNSAPTRNSTAHNNTLSFSQWSRTVCAQSPPSSELDSPGVLSSDRESSMFRPIPSALDRIAIPRRNGRVDSSTRSFSINGIPARRRLGMPDSLSTLSTRSLAGAQEASRNSASATVSDPNEEASLALALALQEEEVQNARRQQAMIDQAVEARNRQDRLMQLQLLREVINNGSLRDSSAANRVASMFVNPDTMSHDELVQLGERMGDVKKERWRERAPEVMSRLPNHRLKTSPQGDNSMCIVCQEDFKVNDHVLTLPCAHIFHYDCVQGWIYDNNACPICKLAIEDE
ncbi:hypothetical protein Ae201684_000890 [Aphanomyces euteiches]|uniref:RING-type E3 ubiquitin transferase n=1 Tax=Aphanomyces euteiches TaxID=100861 RepID=A0A6G0XVD0_9STRA|nr:hypothetical protein Ae201684_000890 [Aphanomyces euteiches]KAH9140642.1 hypothetical protein AeRB84_015142 [Aphanomyces euteiches]KAH9148759.1 hypothetical protein AeRB84_008009 [Aphanomyces euteiches]KAH9150706.1 hypothetical protein AeRB84_006492 [Aphanomyces euteiches]KAH9152391.1 hypothetical protein AeRB84_005169 [Aphanomyces euteiches]